MKTYAMSIVTGLVLACNSQQELDSPFGGGGEQPSPGDAETGSGGESQDTQDTQDGGGTTGDGGGSGPVFDVGGATGDGEGDGGACGGVLHAMIRDFKEDHPDFEDFGGQDAYPGVVEEELGPDDKPVYAHPGATMRTSGPAAFAQWYNDTPGVNVPVPITLTLTETSPGVLGYSNNEFFPLDGEGWNDSQNVLCDPTGGMGFAQCPHNFYFTTEVHTRFSYQGGEVFTFEGDDDLWIFVNGRLALDLGGPHPPLEGTVDFDAQAGSLGISPGNEYSMDIFHAERAVNESNFTISTTIACFTPPG